MKLLIVLLFGLIAMTASANEWVPPEKPDLQAILSEVSKDRKAGRYELALGKLIWFHENALKHDRSMSAVRLSFALADWHRLGQEYPPALEKLKQVREETRKRITADDAKNVSFEDFHELTAFNRELNEWDDTVDMFKFVEKHNPEAAERIYGVSEPALLKAKEYALCNKYLGPDKSVSRALELFNLESEREVGIKYAERHKQFQNDRFIKDAATLVALLVINDRKGEAGKAVHDFKTVEADADFHEKLASALDKALAGELPEQR